MTKNLNCIIYLNYVEIQYDIYTGIGHNLNKWFKFYLGGDVEIIISFILVYSKFYKKYVL